MYFPYMLQRIFQRRRERDTYGEDPTQEAVHSIRRDQLRQIRLYHEKMGEGAVDEVTWEDLEMDDVFYRINHTASYVGEQVLYHRLHMTEKEDWRRLEEKVSYFDGNKQERRALEKKLRRIGKRQNSYYMADLLSCFGTYPLASMVLFRLLQILLVLSLILGIGYSGKVGFVPVCVIVSINLTIFIHEKQKAQIMVICLEEVCALLETCKYIRKNLPVHWQREGFEQEISSLGKLYRLSGRFLAKKLAAGFDDKGVIMEYLLGITLWDLTTYNRIAGLLQDKEEVILRLFCDVGELDMAISIGSFRRSLDLYCCPEFISDAVTISDRDHRSSDGKSAPGLAGGDLKQGRQIWMEEVYHPLVKEAVRNTVTLPDLSIMMGANASGKSTFMKAVAINLILGQTIHTCTAGYFSCPRMQVMTSMAVRDDVKAKESYYVREVRYLKRMLDLVEKGVSVFCAIDEILKGTNKRERLAASEAVLQYLSGKNCIVLVATHDLEIINRMQRQYACYHFLCQMTDRGIEFEYKIHKGMGGDTNAVALLEYYDFPGKVIAAAKERLKELDSEDQ